MNFRTTYILFGVLLGVLALYLATQVWQGKDKDERLTDYVLPSLKKDDIKPHEVTTLVIERSSPEPAQLVFEQRPRGWELVQPALRADNTLIDGAINSLFWLARLGEDEADLTPNKKQFGLDPPRMTVTIKNKNGREWKVFLGDRSGHDRDSIVYVTSSDYPDEVMAVRYSSVDGFFKDLRELRSRDLLSEQVLNFTDAVQQVRLQAAGHEAVSLKKVSGNRWQFEQPDYGLADDDAPLTMAGPGMEQRRGVHGLLQAIGVLRVEQNEDFITDHADDLAKYGLLADKPATLRIALKLEMDRSLTTGRKDIVDDVLLIGNKTDKGDKYYARLGSETAVVALPELKVKPILSVAENPSILRDRDLLQLAQARVDAINVRNNSGLIELRRARDLGEWQLVDDGKPRRADKEEIETLLNDLTGRRAIVEFVTNKTPAEMGFDKPTAVVSIWYDGIQSPAKKEETDAQPPAPAVPQLTSDKPTIQLTFGKKEKELIYVRRQMGEQVTDVQVSQSLARSVDQDKLAFLDRQLPTFPRDADVTKIVLTRDGQTFELVHEKPEGTADATWKLTQPKDLAGRSADENKVNRIIEGLRLLNNRGYIAENPSDSDLTRFGLNPPVVQVTLTIRKNDQETEDRVYRFGKETPKDVLDIYAMQGDRPLVFRVNNRILEDLRADLPDARLFTFAANRVQEVKIQGWQKTLGFLTSVVVQRDPASPNVWQAVQAPEGLMIDNRKMSNFVNMLADLRAGEFVVFKTGPKPEYQLGDKDRLLRIEMTLEGDKTSYTLTIGKLDEEKKGYYAECSTLPGDVFLLSQDQLQQILTDGPKYFGK
ncbi:MAG: DUF4340 domain-containing protein [Gemmataceae bacterium]